MDGSIKLLYHTTPGLYETGDVHLLLRQRQDNHASTHTSSTHPHTNTRPAPTLHRPGDFLKLMQTDKITP